ncbi:hypothetical protein TNCV_3722941 [Trichonephila clavipes]|nr:hypothetical protein TNCV_3722941 [Trichonephila clavipes]
MLRVVHVKVKGEQEMVNAVIDTGAQMPVVRADVVEGQSIDLTCHRVRRRNVNFDYEARGDPIDDPTLKYKAVFFTLDEAINALESRFKRFEPGRRDSSSFGIAK